MPVFRLNTESLLTDYEFCWQADNSGCDFTIHCPANGLSARGSEITALWDRRPEKPEELPITATPQIDRHNRAEALGFLVFLRYYLKEIPSIGSIVNDKPAASKMLQYKIAVEVGFDIPDTCFSNRKSDIAQFAAGHDFLTVKPIDNSNIWDEEHGLEWVFYTNKIESSSIDEAPEEAFSQTVSFVQNYVEKAYELRVTVVGNSVFACKIDSQQLTDDTGKIDWRQGYEHGMQQTAVQLPVEIAERCIEYLRRMGLNFGCFDFIVTPEGRYVFLECNPNGQWLWVELATGLQISEAIADFLTAEK